MTTLPRLIEPKALHTFLEKQSNSDICIIDLSTPSSYNAGHIAGAIHLDFKELMSGESPAPGRLPSSEKLNHLFSRLGLTPKTHFVVYDDEGNGWAGRFIWTLDVIGHSSYSVVNGGIHAWRGDNLPVELGETSNCRSPQNINVNISQAPIAEIEDILHGLQNDSIQIWDARSPAEYRGEKVLAMKGGHIPGAINCEWTSLMDKKNNYRLREDAEEYLQQLGFHKDKPIIAHCQSHHRSAYAYLVGKILGFAIKGYHGSWSEWGNHPDTPVEH